MSPRRVLSTAQPDCCVGVDFFEEDQICRAGPSSVPSDSLCQCPQETHHIQLSFPVSAPDVQESQESLSCLKALLRAGDRCVYLHSWSNYDLGRVSLKVKTCCPVPPLVAET